MVNSNEKLPHPPPPHSHTLMREEKARFYLSANSSSIWRERRAGVIALFILPKTVVFSPLIANKDVSDEFLRGNKMTSTQLDC